MLTVQSRLVRGTHIGKDPKTGLAKLTMCEDVLRRSKLTGNPGHDIVDQQVKDANDPTIFHRRWPERFEPVHGGAPSNMPAGLEMLPGETLNNWHARVGEIVKAQTITSASVGAPVAAPPGPPPSKSLPPADLSTFDAMSVKDLQGHAEAEEIDLKGATKKDDIIRAIKAAYGV